MKDYLKEMGRAKFPQLLADLLTNPETQDFIDWGEEKVCIKWLPFKSYVDTHRLAKWKSMRSFTRQLNVYGLTVSLKEGIISLPNRSLLKEDFIACLRSLSSSSESTKRWQRNNKDKINERAKKRYLNNKDKFREKERRHYLENGNKVRERVRQYRLKNVDKIREKNRKHYLENGNKVRERVRQYSIKNIDKIRERRRRHYLENKDKVRAYTRKRELSMSTVDLTHVVPVSALHLTAYLQLVQSRK